MANPFAVKRTSRDSRPKRATLAGLLPSHRLCDDNDDEDEVQPLVEPTPTADASLSRQAAMLQRALSSDSFASPPRQKSSHNRSDSAMASPSLFGSPPAAKMAHTTPSSARHSPLRPSPGMNAPTPSQSTHTSHTSPSKLLPSCCVAPRACAIATQLADPLPSPAAALNSRCV